MTTTNGWPVRPFKDVADYSVGRTPARANPAFWTAADGNVPWVTISDMPAYGVVAGTKESIAATAHDQIFRGRLVPAGTLLMSFKLTIGRVATLGIPAVHNEAIISIHPKPGIDQRFLGYYLSQADYSQLQDRQIKGNTLNKSKIDRIPVPVPPETEQNAIADMLDTLREAIESEGSALQATMALQAAASRRLFTEGLRGEPLKETPIGPMPASWEPRSIAELCEIWSGGTPRKSMPEYWRGDIPWVSGKDLKLPTIDDTIDHVSPEGVAEGSRLAPGGAVLLLVRGMGLAKDLPVATITRPMAFNQDVKALVPRGEFTGPFLRAAIYAGKERLLGQIVTSAHGTMTLNLSDVEGMMVACPTDADEAHEIVAVLEALEQKIQLHRRRQLVMDELFQSMLQKAMTGDVDADGNSAGLESDLGTGT